MLFSPLDIRGLRLRNRIAVSPMCQYSAQDGVANEWHLVHLGSRAVGGAALVIVEASAITPEGRISPRDLGIWSECHVEAFRPIARFLKQNGAIPGVQIAHAGRKASTAVPWEGGAVIPLEQGGWQTVGPSPIPFRPGEPVPHELTRGEIASIVESFAGAAERALEAGFELLEIHGAHGYLLNEFYSPLANHRTDEYGGPFENRTRIAREVVQAVRNQWPDHLPLFLRISGTDWVDGGWTIDDSVELARMVKPLGVDLIDCSSGGIAPHIRIPVGPGYQVPIAERLRRETGILTGAVGLITGPSQAQAIIEQGQADIVLLAREMLRDPYWPLHASRDLGVAVSPPVQYTRAF